MPFNEYTNSNRGRSFRKHYDHRRQYHKKFTHEKRPARPMPISNKCNPLCALFTCSQRALVIVNKPYRGKYRRVAFCRLTGSECIGAECRYASCKINALLPDGKCAKALERIYRKTSTDEELFKEMESIEDVDIDELRR